jgi:ribose 5-phosphate isomerase B
MFITLLNVILRKIFKMNIAIGNDHAGTTYKFKIIEYLKNKGIKVINFGTDDEKSMDYPDAIHPVAETVEAGTADLGIVICGSGNGAAMTANHHKKIRAALCWNNELVSLARQHNDANILSIPARFVSEEDALQFVKTFINTEFEGGRHQQRIDKIPSDNC